MNELNSFQSGNSSLKACPHCGETKLLELRAIERTDRPKCKWTAEVSCLNCFVTAGTHGFEWTKEDAEREAITAWNLRIRLENKPLSLEEIENMGSEPAYLVDKDANIKRWVIVRAVREDFIIYDNGNVISINDLHRDYDFYAHKPDES